MSSATPGAFRQLVRRVASRGRAGEPNVGQAGPDGAADGWLFACAGLTVAWCAARFVALGVSPPGFFVDEALGAVHLQCLIETGSSAHGEPWPLFARAPDDGYYTPAFLYSGLVWALGFGTSVASMRSLVAAYSVATVVGLWLLARELSDPRSARLVALAAALSPWSFQFSRIAWDPPLAPAFAVWGAFWFFRSQQLLARVGAGVLLALSMYSYPPQRVQVPLFVLLLLACTRRAVQSRGTLAFVGAFCLSSLPLALRASDPSFVGRGAALSIASPGYLATHGGERPVRFFFSKLLDNLHEHLRPDYLFLSGDASLRHSSQIIGQLGWLDDLAVFALLVMVVRAHLGYAAARRAPEPTARYSRTQLVLAACCCFGLGVLPAALTHQGVPHALRSIGAWPALALLTGLGLSAAWARARWVPPLVVAVAIAQSAYFLPRYFTEYPRRADAAFSGSVRRAGEGHDLALLGAAARGPGELLVRYYLSQELGHTCDEARSRVVQLRDRAEAVSSSEPIR